MPGRILIVGGDSEIAAATAAHLRTIGHEVLATTRRPQRVAADRPYLDLSRLADDFPIPDGVGATCLCAAIARLTDCARDPEGSAAVNVSGTVALVDRLLARGIPVVFLSTDKVFDGTRPSVPADAPLCPVSEYGRQKAAAEAAFHGRIAAGAPLATLRLAKVVSPGMPLLRQWIAELASGKPVRAFFDMMMAPTPVELVAAAIERLLMGVERGVFQLTGPGDIAYSEIALFLARRLGADPHLVEPVSALSAGLPPGSTAQFTTLESSALRQRFGIVVPEPWEIIDRLIETCRDGAGQGPP